MPPSQETHINSDVLSSLRRIIRAVDLHSRSLAGRYDLTGPQLMVLRALALEAPRTVSALADAVQLSQATVTGILDRLERKSLVTRTRSSEDKRRVMVAPTDRAEQIMASPPPLLQEHFITAFDRLAEGERSEILRSLARIADLMEADRVPRRRIPTTEPVDTSPASSGAKLGRESA